MISELYVHLFSPGKTTSRAVGKLTHQDGYFHFVYGRSYLESASAFPLDPIHLPLTDRVYSERDLFYSLGVIRDASPDTWGRRVLNAVHKRARLSEMEYLIYSSGRHRVGALEFSTSREVVHKEITHTELGALLSASRQLEAGNAISDDVLLALQGGSSMGGARPKAVVSYENMLWIAKFPSNTDCINIPELEYQTLQMAQHCGIDTVESRLVQINNISVLLVKRFDRKLVDGEWVRKHYLSGLTLIGAREQEGWKHSYLLLADQLRHLGLERKTLYKRMLFNILIGNQDDHARNHGFFYDGEKLSYAPAFDLLPQTANQSAIREQAMIVGSQGRQATIENALSCAERFSLSKQQAKTILLEMQNTINKTSQ